MGGAHADEPLSTIQDRLEEQLRILKEMYEKEGWGAKPLADPRFGKNAFPNATRIATNASSLRPLSEVPYSQSVWR
eukprot:COSAG05_NODE_9_length_39734_cov_180.598067_18_plen_76_part_00